MRQSLVFLASPRTSYKGSRFLRAAQLSGIVQEVLPDLDVRMTTAADDVSDAVVVLNKSFLAAGSPRQVRQLRARGNAVLADYVDLRPRASLCRAVDGFLASSYGQERFLRGAYRDKPTFRVLHHADPRIQPGCAEAADARVGYFGHAANARHLKRLAADGLCDSFFAGEPEDTQWMSRLSGYGVHYAIRSSRLFEGFKPFTKGAVAARCGAVVLAEREEEALASLGADYPFYSPSAAYKDVRTTILRIQDSFGGPEWRAAREAMVRVEEQCSPGRIAQGLAEALAAFG